MVRVYHGSREAERNCYKAGETAVSRPCFGKDCGSVWNFGLEKPLNIKSMMGCRVSENKSVERADDRDPTCEAAEKQRLLGSFV